MPVLTELTFYQEDNKQQIDAPKTTAGQKHYEEKKYSRKGRK